MPTRLTRALPSWLRALVALLLLASFPLNAAELNNSGTGQWSEADTSNTSAVPDGWPVGMAPNQVRPTAQAMMGATKRFWDRVNCTVTSTGSANAYVYTPSSTSFPTAIVAGEIFCFKANFANTGAATLAVNSLTAKNIYKQTSNGPAALSGGEIQNGQLVAVSYDGTQYQLLTQSPPVITQILKKSGTAVTAPADTTEDTLATINVPANIGANAVIRFWLDFACTNNANAKTVRLRFSGGSGTVVITIGIGGTSDTLFRGEMVAANSTSSQVWSGFGLQNNGGTFINAGQFNITSAIDTTAATTIVATVQKASAGDTVTLKGYAFELISDGT